LYAGITIVTPGVGRADTNDARLFGRRRDNICFERADKIDSAL
jgi:hypothetical protein